MVQTPLPSAAVYPASLQQLISSLSQEMPQTPEHVQQLVQQAGITAKDLLPWADFDHPIEDSYGRQLVFHGGQFEVMVMSWNPGDFSAIHDHGATQWGAVQCFGRADHYIYRFAHGQLKTQEAAPYRPGMVRAVDHALIHQMGNSGTVPFLSLHVYGAAEAGAAITGDARVFDVLENSIQYTDGGVFFCLPDPQIKGRDFGLVADPETTLRHHCLMRDRICRILSVRSDFLLEQKLAELKTQTQRLRLV